MLRASLGCEGSWLRRSHDRAFTFNGVSKKSVVCSPVRGVSGLSYVRDPVRLNIIWVEVIPAAVIVGHSRSIGDSQLGD